VSSTSNRTPRSTVVPASPLARGPHHVSIAAFRRQLSEQFRQAALDSPDLDARILVGHALGLDHTALAAQPDLPLTAKEANAIAALGRRRLAHEPVARILGTKEFWGLSFKLNADTLVPRPETETVVEAALAAIDRTRRLRIADLGTGSGALLLALLSELPAASGTGTDISPGALACARDNARALGLSDRAAFVECDYGRGLTEAFDLVVSNPPYVAHGDIPGLSPEVRLFDPPRALDGGPDGLDGYRAIAADAQRLLTPDGFLIVELGAGLADSVSALFTAAGLTTGTVRNDLAGIARALAARPLP
jgi:release factor glutamine methyltransferase